jgi:hypothetical protein
MSTQKIGRVRKSFSYASEGNWSHCLRAEWRGKYCYCSLQRDGRWLILSNVERFKFDDSMAVVDDFGSLVRVQ